MRSAVRLVLALSAGALVAAASATPPLQGSPGAVIFGLTRGSTSSLAIVLNRSGTRIVKLIATCGGNPIHPPMLGKAFIGKRFVAKVSLPVTVKIVWSGSMPADNSRAYDPPIPAQWTRPARFSLTGKFVVRDGEIERLVGTGRLTSAGLPCATVRRYVPNP
jgi:hypothetical protein